MKPKTSRNFFSPFETLLRPPDRKAIYTEFSCIRVDCILKEIFMYLICIEYRFLCYFSHEFSMGTDKTGLVI